MKEAQNISFLLVIKINRTLLLKLKWDSILCYLNSLDSVHEIGGISRISSCYFLGIQNNITQTIIKK